MVHLETIRLRDFQGHVDTLLELTNGVNVLVGSSDTGKSSVVRALRWVVTNKPSGDSFVRKGAKYAEVTITTTDGHTVLRQKGKGVNRYIVDNLELKAFGQSVPPEVAEVLQMDPDLSIQDQHDPAFLLTVSPGEAARVLNRVAGVEMVDKVTRWLKSDTAYHQRVAQESRGEETRLLSLQRSFTPVKGWIQRTERLSERGAVLRELEGEEEVIQGLLDTYHQLQGQLPKRGLVRGWEQQCQAVEALRDQLKVLEQEETVLQRLVDAGATLRQEIKEEGAVLDALMEELTECPVCGEPVEDPKVLLEGPHATH